MMHPTYNGTETESIGVAFSPGMNISGVGATIPTECRPHIMAT